MKRKFLYINLIAAALMFNGCSNLDETLYSSLGQNNFYNTKLELIEAVGRPYTHMQAWLSYNGEAGYYYANTLSADLVAWPQKGVDGFDNGDHIREHYHTWTADESRITSAWNLMWTGVGYCNTALDQLSHVDPANVTDLTQDEYDALIAEVKVLRAYHYMKLMDMFGNIPIVTTVGDPTNPATQTRKEVFDFVEKEILDNVDKLAPTSPTTMGRVTKTVAYAMLSELYLNAEVWSGQARWDDSIKYSDLAINGTGGSPSGGGLSLDPDPLGPFNNTNQQSPEYIFGFPYSHTQGFNYDWRGIYAGFPNTAASMDVDYSGNNAYVVIPTAYDSYKNNDLRKKDWFLIGPQYVYQTTIPILGIREYAGQPLVYVDNIRKNKQGQTGTGSMTDGEENSGARFNKYRSGTKEDPNYLNNNYVIFRLTEMYFNKAEALMRKNNGTATQEAVDLVNASKQRYFSSADWPAEKYTTATLTMDELLAEEGREFIFEGRRRTTLIRFGKFNTGTWWDKTPDADNHTLIYAIPQQQIDANPNLVQNPGY